jgi:RimJ/RimL family protein N-acetyltransferase
MPEQVSAPPPSGLTVRPARAAEIPLLVAFQLEMARETEELELDRATVESGVRAVFEDPTKGEYLIAEEGSRGIAEEGSRVVGCLMVTPEWSDWRNGRVLWIQSVYVPPAERRRGVFRRMYQALRQRVEREPGLKGLRLYVDVRNRSAHAVYEALGMTREHYVLYEWLDE